MVSLYLHIGLELEIYDGLWGGYHTIETAATHLDCRLERLFSYGSIVKNMRGSELVALVVWGLESGVWGRKQRRIGIISTPAYHFPYRRLHVSKMALAGGMSRDGKMKQNT